MQAQTIKIWVKTLRKLRMIHAFTGETMVVILDRLVTRELEQVKRENSQSLQD